MSNYNDGFTKRLIGQMSEFESLIGAIEDNIEAIGENLPQLISYLSDIKFSMPLGMLLRRYMCSRFSESHDSSTGAYNFVLSNGKTVSVKDYLTDNYDITVDDVNEYTEIFLDINSRYNINPDGTIACFLPKPEIKRLLKATTCQRNKMFLVSFALHMNVDDVNEFLTKALAEQTYNYRNPDEIIAYFCQSDESRNSYCYYTQLKEKCRQIYTASGFAEEKLSECEEKQIVIINKGIRDFLLKNKLSDDALIEFAIDNHKKYPYKNVMTAEEIFIFHCQTYVDANAPAKYKELVKKYNLKTGQSKLEGYTLFAKKAVETAINTEQDLLDFIKEHKKDFFSYSKTAYDEFILLYLSALNKTDMGELDGVNTAKNSEQLARGMLSFIPRATTEKADKNGNKIVSNDFIPVFNGGDGKSNKKQTTTLPKEITKNLLIKDRLDDLIRRIKPIERKDLVFLKFYTFVVNLEKCKNSTYQIFLDECNALLNRCGMSNLYPGNRFENLILLSFTASYPFEMFEEILGTSFFNEPEYIE